MRKLSVSLGILAGLVAIDDVGHITMEEAPERTAAEIGAFLSEASL